MGRAVIHDRFGGPEVLELRDVHEPHAGPGRVRVRVSAVGLNAMDPLITSDAAVAAGFGVRAPAGFGTDFSGVVDEVGAGVSGYAVGDRVFGAAPGRAAADHLVLDPDHDALFRTPDGIGDEVACTLPVAGLTATAALAAIKPRPGDTVLIGGAAGGVGVFAVQLVRRAGAAVIGTASPGTFDFLRGLGAEPVAHGPGLADRVRELGPPAVTAAADLFGVEAAEAALSLGVPPERISTIAAGPDPAGGVHATGAGDAHPSDLRTITDAILEGELTVPVTTYPIDRIREAAARQAERRVHGKIAVVL
ncbi:MULTISPECIES: NADP-dependent oxidoreductase [unclassified Nocardiopsis]|uniref:NADP-dependent oxidoreductase n=1 Tax=Nocardiopsis TaxID=2013 RepID=UPI00387A8690